MDLSKKVFGANVASDIIRYFNGLQEGNFTIKEAESVFDSISYQEKTYLGDRTPYARMWVAVNVRESILNDQIGAPLPGGGLNYGKTFIYSINENREDSYIGDEVDPIQTVKSITDTVKEGYQDQLTDGNPFMKPEAGITSISSKSEGAVGALRRTIVQFSVHNKTDFENIFLPFFLKPGSTVFVDFGWTDKNLKLYKPEDVIKSENPRMNSFYKEIYDEDVVGEVEKGFKTTLSGQVTKYDVNVDEKGSFNCSLEFVSSNYALLDKSVSDDNSLKFIFNNLIEELILKYYVTFLGVDISNDIELSESDKISSEERRKLVKDFFDADTNVSNVGIIDTLSKKAGVFYQNITGGTSEENKLNEQEAIYISYGLLEDRFLNKFVSFWITTDEDGREQEELKSDEPFSNSFSNQNTYVRFDDDLFTLQGLDFRNSDERLSFLYPDDWTDTYNKLKPIGWEDAGGVDNDKQKRRIPIRELFISVPLISEAFRKSQNVNDALEFIFNKIYEDSGNIINVKMVANNDAQTSIAFQDVNVEADKFGVAEEEVLTFDLTSGNTVVLNSDLQFETPKGGLSSMIAIGNLKQSSVFDELELLKFNFLNALSTDDKKYQVKHLPIYGEVPSTKKGLDFDIESVTRVKPIDSTLFADSDFRGKETSRFKETNAEYISNRFADYVTAKKEQIKKADSGESTEDNVNEEDKKPLPTETSDGNPIFYSNSERDTYMLRARVNNFVNTDENSISPVMPITLTLKIYGNNFLNIGDFFTVNFLPKHYAERVYFQIVGVDHSIGTSMWETSYTTVMRIKSNKKYKAFGKSKTDFKKPIIKLKEQIKKEIIEESTSSDDILNVNLGERHLVTDVEPTTVYRTENFTKIPTGLSIENDMPLVELHQTVLIYNSKLEGDAAKEYNKISNEIKNDKIKVGGVLANTNNISKDKISISVPLPTSKSNGILSYWIIMSNLLLGDELINWEQIKKDNSEVQQVPKFAVITKGNSENTLVRTPPNVIRVTTSLPNEEDKNGASTGNPTYATFMDLYDEPWSPTFKNITKGLSDGFDQSQKAVNDLIQAKGKSQKISPHIDNSLLESTKRGGFYFFRSIVWPITPDEDNRIVNLKIKGHSDFNLIPQLKIPQKYLKMQGQELARRIRMDYATEKNRNYSLENYFTKNRRVDPGFPFSRVNYYIGAGGDYPPGPFGSSSSAKEARERLGKKFGFNSYDEYRAARDAEYGKDGGSLAQRRLDWRNSSNIW